jgi:hypothetical protein
VTRGVTTFAVMKDQLLGSEALVAEERAEHAKA